MGTRNALGVEPPVAAGGETERQLIVLIVVFSHINMKAVGVHIVQRTAFFLHFVLFAAAPCLQISVGCQLISDAVQVLLGFREIQGTLDGLEMGQRFLCLPYLCLKRLVGPFELAVAVEIFFCVVHGA